jgi:hypothetical protein
MNIHYVSVLTELATLTFNYSIAVLYIFNVYQTTTYISNCNMPNIFIVTLCMLISAAKFMI